ncbi:hypothetical protein C453_10490 [Haloferax elongans ATCC BAA-1513]|uniref:Small CPxCG-related zinc finger protein n=1 Tax=Haloferax elongans ATCC BAA-1513 TaxID=1230453 RepID=M0HMV7_HALEO|nr:hypothetical protein C453_10490 [Haloferax elongans ATCC BAA-1513]
MGDRNHLHVCRHCGVVHGTASSTPPEECLVCESGSFSEYTLNDLLREREPVEPQLPTPEGSQTEHTSRPGIRVRE